MTFSGEIQVLGPQVSILSTQMHYTSCALLLRYPEPAELLTSFKASHLHAFNQSDLGKRQMAGSSWEPGCQWDLSMPLANLYIATPAARNFMDSLNFAPTKSYKPSLPTESNGETVMSSELSTEGSPMPLAEK